MKNKPGRITKREADAWNGHYRRDAADGVAYIKHVRHLWDNLGGVVFPGHRLLELEQLDSVMFQLKYIARSAEKARQALGRVARRRKRLRRMGFLGA